MSFSFHDHLIQYTVHPDKTKKGKFYKNVTDTHESDTLNAALIVLVSGYLDAENTADWPTGSAIISL